jgi:hypothetical protein
MFAGVAAVGIGLGKTAISGFLKKDSVAAQELKFQLAELSGSWAKVGEKIATTKIGGKVLAEWVGVLADKLNKLKPETIERIVKGVLALATIAGLGTVLKVLNEFGDTLERIGILKDRRNLTQWKIDNRGGVGNAANIASNLAGGVIGSSIISKSVEKNNKSLNTLIGKFIKAREDSGEPILKGKNIINLTGLNTEKTVASSMGSTIASKISEVAKKVDFKKTTQAIKGIDTNISRSIADQLNEMPIKLGKSINQMNKMGPIISSNTPVLLEQKETFSKFGKLMNTMSKTFILAAAALAVYQTSKFLGQLEEIDYFGYFKVKVPFAIKKVPEGFKDQEEFDAYLNKGKKDRLSVSNAAIKGAESFLEEVNPIKENLNPKTQEELKKIFTGSEEQITSLNEALANIDRQIRASPNGNDYLEEQKGKLKNLLKSIYSEQAGTVKDYVRTLEEKKKLAEQEADFQKSGVDISRNYNDKLADVEKTFADRMNDLVTNRGEVGRTTDPMEFLRNTAKSFTQFGGDKEKLLTERKKSEDEAKVENTRAKEELESKRARQLEENTSSITILSKAIEALSGTVNSLNQNVAPAY